MKKLTIGLVCGAIAAATAFAENAAEIGDSAGTDPAKRP